MCIRDRGITRGRVGDILISDHSADVVVSPSLAEFLLQNWDSAGRVRLEVSAIVREELTIPRVQIKEVRDTVSSLRLDAVVAAAFSLSRGKAAELIAAGRVSLDLSLIHIFGKGCGSIVKIDRVHGVLLR